MRRKQGDETNGRKPQGEPRRARCTRRALSAAARPNAEPATAIPEKELRAGVKDGHGGRRLGRRAKSARKMREHPQALDEQKPSELSLGGLSNEEPDSDLLSPEIQPTIIGAEAFHCPVRNGKEWDHPAMAVRQRLCLVRLKPGSTKSSGRNERGLRSILRKLPLKTQAAVTSSTVIGSSLTGN